jgi:hypothetical protein
MVDFLTRRAGVTRFRDQDRRCASPLILATALVAIGIAVAAPAHADAGCQTEGWGLFKVKQRTLCDGPIRPDGSWTRERTFWIPAHQVPFTCTYGDYSSSCSGGYFVDDSLVSDEHYVVTPDTVLPDEPGHLL